MRLLFVGDVMLGRLVNDALKEASPEHPWGNTLDIFEQADWRACNLECAISDRGAPWRDTPKQFHFRTDAKNVEVLKAAGVNCVSLANNHALDYGYDALDDTIRILSDAGIAHAGAGANRTAAGHVVTMRENSLTIGFVAFTDNMAVWEAMKDKAGVYYVPIEFSEPRTAQLLHRVKAAREEVDVLIVSAHWGPNWGYTPPQEHVALGRALMDNGATVVFGHSAHICRGVEMYRNRPILYSTGDFVDDYAVDPEERNDRSFVFCINLQAGEVESVDLIPTVIRDFQALKAQGDERREIADKMMELCRRMDTRARWSDADGCLRVTVERTAEAAK